LIALRRGYCVLDKGLLSSQQVLKEAKERSQCFIILTQLSIEEGDENVEILVVTEFVDVFPKDVLGLLPKREVEFSIDLVPRAGLV